MKATKKWIMAAGVFLLLSSCNPDNDKRSLEYFKQNLDKEISYEEIVKKFGKPAEDIGSGIHVYVYPLSDSSEVRIGYADKIIYAKHFDKDGLFVEDIL